MFAAKKIFASVVNRRTCAMQAAVLKKELFRKIGDGACLSEQEQAIAGEVISGKFWLKEIRQGFFLHCTDVVHVQAMTSRFLLSKSGLKIFLKLQGSGHLRIDRVPLPLGDSVTSKPVARAAVVSLKEPAQYEHCCRAASRERMLVITLMPEWLVSAGLGHLNALQHLSMTAWNLSPRLAAVAEQLMQSVAEPDTALQRLRIEQQALHLAVEALAALAPENVQSITVGDPVGLRPAEYQRASQLRAWLDGGGADGCTMEDIALHMGCNACSLQSQFRQAFGQPIFDYLREQRLRRAANAILTKDLTMAQAAELAGYSSQANFSTAFRKLFGFSPKNLRARGQ